MAITGFYTTEKKVKADLFDTTADKIAGSFVGKDRNGRTYGVSKSQLRKLYNEVKRFEQNLDGSIEAWDKNYPYIRMIKSKSSYNTARAGEKDRNKADVYKNLSAFIAEGIDLIKDEEDYRVFTALFEAVYGFYYEKNPKDN
jgi:CRISPR-associated protein Csm2